MPARPRRKRPQGLDLMNDNVVLNLQDQIKTAERLSVSIESAGIENLPIIIPRTCSDAEIHHIAGIAILRQTSSDGRQRKRSGLSRTKRHHGVLRPEFAKRRIQSALAQAFLFVSQQR